MIAGSSTSGGSGSSSAHAGASNVAFPSLPKIDPLRERYPLCVVWTPIPVLSWLLPMIGHMGICDSQGIIHDFAGPYYISEDSMLFGNPVKYWDISSYLVARKDALHNLPDGTSVPLRDYDLAVATTTDYFRQTQMYNFFTNNCHSFVTAVMETACVGKSGSWNMVKLTLFMMVFGRYVSIGRFLKAHLPCIVLWLIVYACVRLGESRQLP